MVATSYLRDLSLKHLIFIVMMFFEIFKHGNPLIISYPAS